MVGRVASVKPSAAPPLTTDMAAVATAVIGQSALTATPAAANSSACPRTHIDMPNLAMVYAARGAGSRTVGGLRCHRPRPLIYNVRMEHETPHDVVQKRPTCKLLLEARACGALEPLALHVQRRTKIQNVRICSLHEMRNTRLAREENKLSCELCFEGIQSW